MFNYGRGCILLTLSIGLLARPAAAQSWAGAHAVVEALYQRILNRAPDSGGRSFFINRLERDGVSVRRLAEDVAHSNEARMRFTDAKSAEQTMRLAYATFLGRPVGNELAPNELSNVAAYQSGGSGAYDAMVSAHFNSPEYLGKYGDDVVPGGSVRYCPSQPSALSVAGSYQGPPGWDRGMQSTAYCGNSPESWVRGSVSFDSSGKLTMTIQLETDSTIAGPKGRLRATIKDASGASLATAESEEVGTGGKPPGKAAIRNFTAVATVPSDVASKARSIYLEARCVGSVDRLWNIKLDTVTDAFKIAVAVSAMF
jgi:hypothetical protein